MEYLLRASQQTYLRTVMEEFVYYVKAACKNMKVKQYLTFMLRKQLKTTWKTVTLALSTFVLSLRPLKQ